MNALSDATGLMIIWADIDPGYVLRFQEWHNCEHLPERMSIPGFVRGRRYRAEDGSPHFQMMYDTKTPEVLTSEAYLARLNAPTPWTRESLAHFSNPLRSIFRQVATVGTHGAFAAPWLTALRFNGGPRMDWRAWAVAMVAHPAVMRAQVWAVDDDASGIVTTERKIYRGSASGQKSLLLIETAAPAEVGTEALAAADAAVPAAAERKGQILRRYWLDGVHDAAREL